MCSVDGTLSEWGEWGECSKSCEGGTRSRDRNCTFVPDKPMGADCNDTLTEAADCNTEKCPGKSLFVYNESLLKQIEL